MKIKPKVQRKLELLSKQSWSSAASVVQHLGGSEWSVQGLGIGHGADCQVHICLWDASAGSEAGWASARLASSGWRCAAPWDPALMGGMRVGSLCPLALGLSIPPPQSAGASTEELPSPRVSAASLRTLRSLYLRPSFFWFCFFISDCCAQDCESEKPPRSQHQCKHTRVYLQAWACVHVYPTVEQGLGPRGGF